MQFVLRGVMNRLPMGRENPEEGAIAGNERSRLHSAESGVPSNITERFKVRIALDVGDHHALTRAASPSTAGCVFNGHVTEEVQKFIRKPAVSYNGERPT